MSARLLDNLLECIDSTEAFKKASADWKLDGVNILLLPLTVCSSDHTPSISVSEHNLTVLARSKHSW